MRRTGAMADDSVHHTVNGTVDLSEEESVSREISELLESLERSNAAQLLETTFRPKLAAASSKLTALYEENARRIAAALEDSNTKIPNMPLYDSAEANSSAQKSDMLYNLMMQKRLNNMKRSLELADLKARSVTNQWTIDKGKIKEEIEFQKAERDAAINRMRSMDAKIRLAEQLIRDPTIDKTTADVEDEMHELEDLRIHIADLENELQIKKNCIEEYERDLADSKTLRETAGLKIEQLKKNVDDLVGHKRDLGTQLREAKLEVDHLTDLLASLKEELDAFKTGAKAERDKANEAERVSRRKVVGGSTNNADMIVDLEESLAEMQAKANVQEKLLKDLRKEKDYLIIANEAGLRESKLLVEALKNVAVSAKLIASNIEGQYPDLAEQLEKTRNFLSEIKSIGVNVSGAYNQASVRRDQTQKLLDEYRVEPEHVLTKRLRMLEEKDEKIRELEQELATLHDASSSTSKPASKVPSSKVAKVVHDNKKEKELERDLVIAKQTIKKLENEVVEAKMAAKIPKRKSMKPLATEDANGLTPRNKAPEVTEKLVYSRRNSNVELSSGTVASMIPTGSTDKHEDGKANEDEEDVALDELRGELQQLTLSNMRLERELEEMQAKSSEAERSLASTKEFADEKEKENEQLHAQLRKLQKKLAELSSPKALVSPKEQVESANSMAKFSTATKLSSIDENDKQDQYAKTLTSPSRIDPVVSSIGRENRLTVDTRFNDDLADNIIAGVLGTPLKMDGATNTSIPGTPITPAFRAINSMRRLSTFRAINPNASTDIRNSFMSQRSVDTADREKIQISMETLQEILKSVKEENGYLDTGSEADDATSRDLLQIIYNTCQASCDLAHFAATSKADEDVALKKYVEAVVKNHATELLVMADRAKDGAHDKLAADYDAQLKAKVEEVATSLKKMHEEQAESRIQAYQDDISFLKGEVSILLGRLSALDENGKIIDKTQRKIPHHDKRYSKNRRASNDSHVASLSDSMSASVDITSNMSAVESYIPPNSRHSIRDSIPEHSSTAKTSAIKQRIAEPDTKLPREGKPSNQTSSNYSDLDLESLEERSVNEIPQDSLTFSGKQSKRKNLVIPKVEIDFIPPEGELSPLKVGEDVGNGRIRTFSSGCKDEEDGKTVASAESSKSRKKSALKSSKYPAHEKPSSSSTPINIADDELSIGSRGSNGSNTSLSSARKKPNLEASSASTKGIAMTESPQNQYYSPVNAHEDSNVLSKHELAHLERVEFDKNLELMKDEILEPITLSQVRARMLDNSAGALGNVTADSFDRLRSKNFGSDDLVALTITEHHLRHSSNNNNRPQDQNFRTQLRALTIQRDILRKKVLLSTGLLGLLEYQHTTEKYIALLSSMSVWQKISHFASGGQFLDILYLHRDVICECIDAGGGWMNALPLVNTLSDIKIETTQWPEFFRVRALEILRKRLLKDNKSLVEELEDAQDILIEAQEAVKDARLEASQLRAQLQQAESMNNTTNMFFNPNFRMPSSPGHSPGSKDSADKKFFPSSGAPATLPPLQIPQFPTAIPHELSKAAVSPFPDFLSYSGPTAENLRSFLSFPTYEQLAEKASEQKQSASTELIDTAEILKSAVASPKQIALLNEIKDGRFDENSSAPTEPIAPTVVAPIFDIEPMVVSTAGDSKSSPVASPKAVSPFTVEKELKLLQAVSPASQLRYHLEKQQQAQLQQMNLIQQQQLNQLQEMQKFQLKQLEELRQQRHFKQQGKNLQELPKADTKDLFDSSSRIASIDHPIESVNNCEVFDNTGNSVSCIDKEPVESKESPLLIQSPQSNEDEKIEQEMQLAQQQILLMQIQEMQGLRQQQMQQLEVLKFHQEQQLKQFQQAADMEAAYRQQMEEKGRKAENFNPLLQRQQSVRGDVKSPAVHGTDYHRDVRHDVAPNPFVRRKDSLPGTLVRQSSQISELGMESTDANESVGSRGEKFPPQPLTRQHSMSHNAKQTHINANNVNDPFIRKPTANKLKKQPSLARMLGALEHSSDNQNKEVEDPDQRRQEHEMRMIQQQYRDLQFNFMQLQQQLLAQERQHQQEQFKWFMEQQQLLQVNSPVAASAKATGAIRLETKGNDIPISESKQKSSDLDDVNNSIPMDTGHKASESAKKREEDVELPRQNTGVAIAENMMMGVADTLGVPPSSQLSFSNLPQPNQSEDAQNIPSPSPVYSDQLQKLNFFSPQFAAYPPNMFQQMYNPSQIDQAGNTSSTGTGPGQQMMSFPPSMFQQMYNPSQIGQQPSNHIVKIPQAGPNRITSMLQQMYKPSPMNQQVRNYGAEGPDITSSDYIANELRQRAFQRKQLRNASMGISSFSSDTNSQGAKPRTSRIWSKVYDSIRGSEKSSASADNLEPPKNEFRLHAAADRLCIRALNGDNRAARIMRSIIDGVELWSKGESKAGFVTNFHEIDIDARSVDTEDSDSRLSIQALLNDLLKLSEMETVPLEVGEVNQKLIKILDYCEENNIRHATTRDEEEQMAEIVGNASMGRISEGRENLVVHLKSGKVVDGPINVALGNSIVDLRNFPDTSGGDSPRSISSSNSKFRGVAKLAKPLGGSSRVRESSVRAVLTYDASTQTTADISHPAQVPVVSKPGTAGPEARINQSQRYMNSVPNGFKFAHYKADEFQVLPGVYLADANNLFTPSKVIEGSMGRCTTKLRKPIESIPMGVRYCKILTENRVLPDKLRFAPEYLDAEEADGYVAVLFPTILRISRGVNLVTEVFLGEGLDLPPNVILIQLTDKAILPKGLTIVKMSPNIKLYKQPENGFEGLDLLQVDSAIRFPIGSDIYPGCKVLPPPEGVTLPHNVICVSRSKSFYFKKSDIISPITHMTDVDEEDLNIHLRMSERCTIVKRPPGVKLPLGVELIRRPQGLPMPNGCSPLPQSEYPPGISVEDTDIELVRLTPRFEFPENCKVSKTWYLLPRPVGVRMSAGTHILYPDPYEEIRPLPPCVCQVPMPELPYSIRLPAKAIAVEFMLSRADYCLPEGAIIADGITVLDPHKYMTTTSEDVSTRGDVIYTFSPNALLVYRTAGSILPPGIMRGSRNDVPTGLLLAKNMDIILIPVRYELPAGVGLETGAILGQNVQLAPGTILCPNVEVVEHPHGLQLARGNELVKLPDFDFELPFEFERVYLTTEVKLPTNCIIIKLPYNLNLPSAKQLAEKITVGVEALVDKKNMKLPDGMVFVSKETRKSQYPPDLIPVQKAQLPQYLQRALHDINSDMHVNMEILRNQLFHMNLEIARIEPHYHLPPGTEIVRGVKVLAKPFWLQTPRWVELVTIDKNINPTKAFVMSGINRVQLRKEYIRLHLGENSREATLIPFSLPLNSELILLPDSFEVYSWGNYLPGIDVVKVQSKDLFLPPAHFLIERSRNHKLPSGIGIGLAPQYLEMMHNLPHLPPGCEIMHIKPSYYLPLGINLLNTTVLAMNDFVSERAAVPQLCAGEKLCYGASVIPHPLHFKPVHDRLFEENMMQQAYVFVLVDNPLSLELPIDFHLHEDSDSIVEAVFSQYSVEEIMAQIIPADDKPDILTITTTMDYVPNLDSPDDLEDKFSGQNTPDGSRPPTRGGLTIVKKEDLKSQLAFLYDCKISDIIKLVRLPQVALKTRDRMKRAQLQERSKPLGEQITSETPVIVHPRLNVCKPPIEYEQDLKRSSLLAQATVFRVDGDLENLLVRTLEYNIVDAAMERLRQVADKLESENRHLKSSVDQLTKQQSSMKEKISKLQGQLSTISKEGQHAGDLKAIIEKLKQKLGEKISELNSIKNTKDDSHKRLLSRIDMLTTQLANYEDQHYKTEEKGTDEAAEAIPPIPTPAIVPMISQQKLDQMSQILAIFCEHLDAMTNECVSSMAKFDPVVYKAHGTKDAITKSKKLVRNESPEKATVAQSPSLIRRGALKTPKELKNLDVLPIVISPMERQRRVGFDEEDVSILTEEGSMIIDVDCLHDQEVNTRGVGVPSSDSLPSSPYQYHLATQSLLLPLDTADPSNKSIEPNFLNVRKRVNVGNSRSVEAEEVQSLSAPMKLSTGHPRGLDKRDAGSAANTSANKSQTEKKQAVKMAMGILANRRRSPFKSTVPMYASASQDSLLPQQMRDDDLDRPFEELAQREDLHLFSKISGAKSHEEQSTVIERMRKDFHADIMHLQATASKECHAILTLDENNSQSNSVSEAGSLLVATQTVLDNITNKFVNLVQTIRDIDRKHYYRILLHMEREAAVLVRSLSIAENRSELYECFLREHKTNSGEYSQIVNEGLREKIFSLEMKIERLKELQFYNLNNYSKSSDEYDDGKTENKSLSDENKEVSGETKSNRQPTNLEVLQNMINNLSDLNLLEKQLKFNSLMTRQRAAKEEEEIQEKLTETAHDSQNNRAGDDIDFENKEAKLLIAKRYLIDSLRKKSKLYSDRAAIIHKEIDSCYTDVIEHIQGYERQVQSIVPPKLLARVMRWGTKHFEEAKSAGKVYSVTTTGISVGSESQSFRKKTTLTKLPSGDGMEMWWTESLPTPSEQFKSGGRILIASKDEYDQENVSIGPPIYVPASLGDRDTDNASLASMPSLHSLSTAQSNLRALLKSNLNSNQNDLLANATKTLNSKTVKFGQAGSMPLAPVSSHLLYRPKTDVGILSSSANSYDNNSLGSNSSGKYKKIRKY